MLTTFCFGPEILTIIRTREREGERGGEKKREQNIIYTYLIVHAHEMTEGKMAVPY